MDTNIFQIFILVHIVNTTNRKEVVNKNIIIINLFLSLIILIKYDDPSFILINLHNYHMNILIENF